MVKWLNGCGEADYLLFCNHYTDLLTLLNTQYSISTSYNQYPICRTGDYTHTLQNALPCHKIIERTATR